MLIFGEKLNSSIPSTLEMYNNKDEAGLIEVIKAQEGADYLDINTALCSNEPEMLKYMIELCQANSDAKIMPDSADPEVLKEAVKYIKGNFILNSVTCDERINELMPVVCENDCGVICLPMDEDGVPESGEDRLANALKIVKKFEENGVDRKRLYMDVLVQPVATDSNCAAVVLDTLDLYKKEGLITTCGLSNVSFGLPQRGQVNAGFLSLLISRGLDSAICNAGDQKIKNAVKITEMLMGQDDYCMNYVMFAKKK